MGCSLSVLSAAIGVAQVLRPDVALQWTFASTIMAFLFIATVTVAVLAWSGKQLNGKRSSHANAEYAPLLKG